MNKEDKKETIEYCADILYKTADFSKVENIHWIGNPYDNGQSYCSECCEKKVKELNKELKLGEEDSDKAFVDGGWDGACCDGGHESPELCDSCMGRLDYSLSNSGTMEECHHFLTTDLTEINSNTLIELYHVFEGFSNSDFDDEEIKDIYKLSCIVLSSLGKRMGIESRFELLDL